MHNTGLLIQSLTRGRVSAVDVMQAQLQMIRDREIAETGASSVQLLPREYVKRYDKESQKISPLAQRLLNTYQLADVNKAYVKIQKKIHPDVSPETSRLSTIVNEAKDIVLNDIS